MGNRTGTGTGTGTGKGMGAGAGNGNGKFASLIPLLSSKRYYTFVPRKRNRAVSPCRFLKLPINGTLCSEFILLQSSIYLPAKEIQPVQ